MAAVVDQAGTGAAALFGVVLATMNVVFYIAIEYLPLGTAVAIEFLGPVAVAGVTGRGWRDRVGIALAAVGVVLLAGVQLEGGLTTDVVIGLVAILGSAAAWAGYILLGRRMAVKRDGISALAVGMTAGALLYSPLAIGAVGAGRHRCRPGRGGGRDRGAQLGDPVRDRAGGAAPGQRGPVRDPAGPAAGDGGLIGVGVARPVADRRRGARDGAGVRAIVLSAQRAGRPGSAGADGPIPPIPT